MSIGNLSDQRGIARGPAPRNKVDQMDNLVFSGSIRLDGIPHARFFNRATIGTGDRKSHRVSYPPQQFQGGRTRLRGDRPRHEVVAARRRLIDYAACVAVREPYSREASPGLGEDAPNPTGAEKVAYKGVKALRRPCQRPIRPPSADQFCSSHGSSLGE
jgi:hypothetical protein